MALQMIPGSGMWIPKAHTTTAFNTTGLIDATGEKFAHIGQVWTPTGGAKSIRKVGFRFGTVVKAGGSALTVSLQDVDTANGPPWRPDETQDQTVAIANGNAAFASNTWIQTGNLSADRSVNFGDYLAVVVEYDGSGRLGADSAIINNLPITFAEHGYGCVLKTGGTWASISQVPNVVLEFSDGTFGGLFEGTTWTTFGNAAINTGSTPDEVALEFQVPWQCQVDGAFVTTSGGATADYQILLYDSDGNTVLTNGTINVDANELLSAGVVTNPRAFGGLVTLQANTTYRLALKPTTANNVTYYTGDVDQAAYFGPMEGGTSWAFTSRTDAGAWAAATATRRPMFGLRFVSFHDGGGAHFFGG